MFIVVSAAAAAGGARAAASAASGDREREGAGESEAEGCDYDLWLQGSDAGHAGQGPVWGRRGSDVRLLQFSEWPQGGADVTGWCLVTWGLDHIPPWLAASSNCFFRAWKETRVLDCFTSVTSLRKLRLLSISANKRWEILTLCQYLLTEFSVSQTVFRQCGYNDNYQHGNSGKDKTARNSRSFLGPLRAACLAVRVVVTKIRVKNIFPWW